MNLVTLVNGRERESRQLRGWVNHRDGIDEPAPFGEKGEFERIWHAIDVEFPVGKEVVIERRYRVSNGNSVAAAPEIFFEYTTATGGVWKGTIGEMIADVTLKDGLTVGRLLWNSASGTGSHPSASIGAFNRRPRCNWFGRISSRGPNPIVAISASPAL